MKQINKSRFSSLTFYNNPKYYFFFHIILKSNSILKFSCHFRFTDLKSLLRAVERKHFNLCWSDLLNWHWTNTTDLGEASQWMLGIRTKRYRYLIWHKDLESNWLNYYYFLIIFVVVTHCLFFCSLSSVSLMLSTSTGGINMHIHCILQV